MGVKYCKKRHLGQGTIWAALNCRILKGDKSPGNNWGGDKLAGDTLP
jgi:hypothetical protein